MIHVMRKKLRIFRQWECEAEQMNYEVEIPNQFTEPLLQYAAENEMSVEEIVESAIKKYLERMMNSA